MVHCADIWYIYIPPQGHVVDIRNNDDIISGAMGKKTNSVNGMRYYLESIAVYR